MRAIFEGTGSERMRDKSLT